MKVAMSGIEPDSDHESLGAWVKKEGIDWVGIDKQPTGPINGWIGRVPHGHIN